MDNIGIPKENFDFNTLSLGELSGIQGGAYFTKLSNNGKPFYIQTPKCLTRQGVVRTDKKVYIDLMFDNTNREFIQWLENLEIRCHELIFEKSNEWFAKPQSLDDIESAFASPVRIYKSGKYYLVRLNIKLNTITNKTSVRLYDEKQGEQTIYDITPETSIISIIEIHGIKFTSQSFQLEMELKQGMIMNPEELFDNCLIKTTTPQTIEETIKGGASVDKSSVDKSSVDKSSVDKSHLEIEDNESNKKLSALEALSEKIMNEKSDDISEEGDYDDDSTVANEDEDEDEDEEDEDEEDEEEEDDIPKLQLGDETNIQSTILNTKEHNGKVSFNNELEEIDFHIEPSLINTDDENNNTLQEIIIEQDGSEYEPIKLKQSHNVYIELYKQALKKARVLKHDTVLAYLEAKNIKKTYMLGDLDESDDDNGDDLEQLF